MIQALMLCAVTSAAGATGYAGTVASAQAELQAAALAAVRAAQTAELDADRAIALRRRVQAAD